VGGNVNGRATEKLVPKLWPRKFSVWGKAYGALTALFRFTHDGSMVLPYYAKYGVPWIPSTKTPVILA